MHIDTSIHLSIQKHPIMCSRIVQKHLLLLGYEFPKTKLAFALYGDSMQAIQFVKHIITIGFSTYNYHIIRH